MTALASSRRRGVPAAGAAAAQLPRLLLLAAAAVVLCPGWVAAQPSDPLDQLVSQLNTTAAAAAAPVGSFTPSGPSPGWLRGRTTYYGGPDFLSAAYDPARGEGSFGILTFGSCGYTNTPGGTLPFPRDAVAAAADADYDYPGSCGRCYQVKCVDGAVAANSTSYVRITNGTYDGDRFRPYLPAIKVVRDTRNRTWPGNPGEGQGLQVVKCWDTNKVITVRIIDSCPCRQVLKEGAPGVAKGGEVRRQEWCCGGQNHFDLSYFAFEDLAHPVYGVMGVDYRPVDCDSGAPLPLPPAPGYVSTTVYDGGIRPGWGWYTYSAGSADLAVPGAGLSNDSATCVQLSPGGGLTFRCRACGITPGYQPFAGASGLSLWIRPNSNSSDPFASSTPNNALPPLKLFVTSDDRDAPNANGTIRYCFNEVYFNSTSPAATRPVPGANNTWYQMSVPLSAFKCEGAVATDQLNRFDLQNVAERDAFFCLDKVAITAAGSGGGGGGGGGGGSSSNTTGS